MSYEELLRKRIFAPLGMTSTSLTLSNEMKKRLAPGYSASLQPVKNWDFDVLAGCGGIRSTVNDMLKFLAANLELTDSPLRNAMRRMRSVDKDTGEPDLKIAMAWHIFTKFDEQIYWHNGGTYGYRSFVGFNPSTKEGVVILCNTFVDNDDLGRHILESRYPVVSMQKEVQLDAGILERYVGEYEIIPAFRISVTREGSRLFLQATGQPRFEIFAKSDTEFFLKVVDAQITFGKDGLVLHQNGADQKAKRIN
jgi:CubicO group peptidase (beta-lactamase class C family)